MSSFKEFFQEHYQSVKQFGFRSGRHSGFYLIAKVISRWQKLPEASKELMPLWFPQAMENLENHQIKFHTWKNHGILENLNNHGKIMEFCEIIL